MQGISAIFLDDGGVMNDNALRSAGWQRLVGEFFVPILGGDQAAWAEANRVVFERILEFLTAGPQGQDYIKWWDDYQALWLREMAAFVGVAAPKDYAQCVELADEAAVYITQRVRAAYPGATDAVHAIHGMGIELFTASGERSLELDGYLTGMGIRSCFRTLYGPDLVNQAKDGPEYYSRLFWHANVEPKSALVVDDNVLAVAWARIVGAKTCLISASPPEHAPVDLVIPSLAELPSVIKDHR